MSKRLKMRVDDKLERERAAAAAEALSPVRLTNLLKKTPLSTSELMGRFNATEREVMDAILAVQGRGYLLTQLGQHWSITRNPAFSEPTEYISRKDNTYLFGISADQHLGSKYERLDVLNDLYDKFADAGVDRVYNAGNWIDGEARFNLHDLKVHGMDPQCWHLAEHYPQRKGITTYAVAGDDHEGWYGQREGVDIGKHAERIFRDAGRKDWVHLGFMESFVNLTNHETRRMARLLVMHPGGGSAYAHSYKPQKIVESFAGGEKPAVLLIGHYHKMSQNPVRNVWAIQSGCTQDQTPFMRKKSIEAHVGGGIVKLTQDPETGAIVGCRVEFFQYFNRDYYNHRWSHAGPVSLVPRGA